MSALLLEGFTDAAPAAEHAAAVRYVRAKTRAADGGAKSRANFGNLYALAALCAHYLSSAADGQPQAPARYRDLLADMRARPHGARLQNHPLNHRLNEEYCRIAAVDAGPVLRSSQQREYRLDPGALTLGAPAHVSADTVARWVVAAVDAYADARRRLTQEWIEAAGAPDADTGALLAAMVSDVADARAFEVGSYALLCAHFAGRRAAVDALAQGWTAAVKGGETRPVTLHRLGRTNANDGGVDFLLRPLGQVFQVTEVVTALKVRGDLRTLGDVPVVFVVKTDELVADLVARLRTEGLTDQELLRVEGWVTRQDLLGISAGLVGERRSAAAAALERELRREWL